MTQPAPEPTLVGVTEIADLLGVSRQWVAQLVERRGFPDPVARVGQSRVWRVEDVRAWDEARDRAQ